MSSFIEQRSRRCLDLVFELDELLVETLLPPREVRKRVLDATQMPQRRDGPRDVILERNVVVVGAAWLADAGGSSPQLLQPLLVLAPAELCRLEGEDREEPRQARGRAVCRRKPHATEHRHRHRKHVVVWEDEVDHKKSVHAHGAAAWIEVLDAAGEDGAELLEGRARHLAVHKDGEVLDLWLRGRGGDGRVPHCLARDAGHLSLIELDELLEGEEAFVFLAHALVVLFVFDAGGGCWERGDAGGGGGRGCFAKRG